MRLSKFTWFLTALIAIIYTATLIVIQIESPYHIQARVTGVGEKHTSSSNPLTGPLLIPATIVPNPLPFPRGRDMGSTLLPRLVNMVGQNHVTSTSC